MVHNIQGKIYFYPVDYVPLKRQTTWKGTLEMEKQH